MWPPRRSRLIGRGCGRAAHLVRRIHDVFGEETVRHPVQVARLDLPHENAAIGALDQQVVVERTPLDEHDGKYVTAGDHHRLALLQAEQGDRVIARYRAHALQYARLQHKQCEC